MVHLISMCLASLTVTAGPTTQPVPYSGGTVPNYSVRTLPASTPVVVGHDPQLFVDSYLISEWRGLIPVTHSLRRILGHPILGPDQGTTQSYLTVVRDADTRKFRMWYDKYIGPEACIAYAESDDGVQWMTPNLGIMGNDNRLFRISSQHKSGYGASVIDEGPGFSDKPRRFKAVWYGQEKPDAKGDLGMRVAFSPDGLHWNEWEDNPVLHSISQTDDPFCPHCIGDIVDVYRDPVRGRYGAFVKMGAYATDGWTRGPRAKGAFRRLVGASASDDFVHWELPWRVAIPEPRDEGQLEFYAVGGTIARGGLLIGFARMLHDDLPATPGGPVGGIGYATLVTSRDGKHWERHDDVFFDRDPDPEAWDHAMTWISSVVPVGDELYIYYGGYKRGHKIEKEKERQIGMTRMPTDRFVSRDAQGDTPGRLITVPLRLPEQAAHRLVLNVDASRGSIRVQLKDALGDKVLPGYTLDDCEPITGDGQAVPVGWRGKKDLPNDVVRIQFEMTRVSLFGFRLVPAE